MFEQNRAESNLQMYLQPICQVIKKIYKLLAQQELLLLSSFIS